MTQEIKTRIEQIHKSQVPGGYKKTKLGIVPNEWGQCLLSDLVTLKNGINADISKFGKGVKLISVSDILSSKPVMYDSINASIDISEELLDTYSVDYGDIIFQRSSENYEYAGTSNVYLDTKTATFGGFVIRGKKKADYNPQFLNLFLKSFGARKNIIRLAAGSQHVNISQDSLSKLQLYLPPLLEQEKIAEILTIQDTIIELKEKRIAEKEKQKKYLMQNLLTGKKRLAGFSGEWAKVKFGDCLLERSDRNKDLKITNVLSVSNRIGFIKQSEQFGKKVASKDLSNYKVIQKKFIAYNPSRINVGSIAINNEFENGIVSPMYVVMSTMENINDLYFMNYITTHQFVEKMKMLLSGSVRDSLSFTDLSRMKIVLPPLPEQNAIAEILSTADKEIELLKKDLDAEKEKKKSLMQLLLTGIVRVES